MTPPKNLISWVYKSHRSLMFYLHQYYQVHDVFSIYRICIQYLYPPKIAAAVRIKGEIFLSKLPNWFSKVINMWYFIPVSLPPSLPNKNNSAPRSARERRSDSSARDFFLGRSTELTAAPSFAKGKTCPHLKWKKWCGETLQHGVRPCIPAVSEYQVLVGLVVECRVCLDSTISQPSEAPLDWTLGWFVRITACERDTWGWKEREKRAMKHDLWLSESCGSES